MFYITPLTANELLNKKTLLQKESKCGVLYKRSVDAGELGPHIAPGFGSHLTRSQIPSLTHPFFFFPGAITYTIVVKW